MASLDALPGFGWIAPASGKAFDALQRHIPLGPAWLAFRVPGKVAYLLGKALARAFDDAWQALAKLPAELDPRTTTELITEWETAVDLPDICLPAASTLQQRRDQVMLRLSKKRWSTAQDWKDLALLFGLTVTITPGWYVQRRALFGDYSEGFADFEFPLNFDNFPKLGRFRVYIDFLDEDFDGFEYGEGDHTGFPIPFLSGDARTDAFMCMINRVKPANVVVIWNAFPFDN